MGGFFGPELKIAGFEHLAIKGASYEPVSLWVHDEEIKVACIGRAGENLVILVNIGTDLKIWRDGQGGCIARAMKLKTIAK